MNPDHLEQRLSQQPMRQVPSDWRAEILAAGRVAADVNRRSRPIRELTFAATWRLRLRELLWPHPKAWAGLAAVWLVIVAMDFSTRDASPTIARKSPPPSPELLMALRQQERLLAELIERPEVRTVAPPKRVLPRPSSQRRDDNLAA